MSMKIVNMLMEYELLVSELYGICAEKFPKMSAFWKGLAEEEIRHAKIIEDTMAQVDGRNVTLNSKRFNARPLEISMEHVKEIIGRIEMNDIDLLGILSLALDIEQSIIESKYYELFSGRSREFNERMKTVRNESRGHAMKIREMKQRVLSGE